MKMFNKNLYIVATLTAYLVLGSLGSIAAFAAGPTPVNLGSAGNFVILTKSGISTTGVTTIIGNIGVSPAAATYITGFGLVKDSSGTFSRSTLVTGKVFAANYAVPTPSMLTTAVNVWCLSKEAQ